MNWEEKKQVIKGNVGERIVLNALEKKGYVVYKAITPKAHAFDFLAVKNKQIFLIAEVKSKARLNFYEATGIDVRHYKEYINILENQKIDIILFFVDEHPKEERVYCQKLSVLCIEKTIGNLVFPNYNISKGKVMFALSEMKNVQKLTKEEVEELKKNSTRTYKYS